MTNREKWMDEFVKGYIFSEYIQWIYIILYIKHVKKVLKALIKLYSLNRKNAQI